MAKESDRNYKRIHTTELLIRSDDIDAELITRNGLPAQKFLDLHSKCGITGPRRSAGQTNALIAESLDGPVRIPNREYYCPAHNVASETFI